MGESGVTQSQFYEAMGRLDDKLQDYHKRQRDHIESKVATIESIFRIHESADVAVEKRVTRIEEQRAAESNAIAKLSAMTSAIVTAVLYAGATMFKKLGQ